MNKGSPGPFFNLKQILLQRKDYIPFSALFKVAFTLKTEFLINFYFHMQKDSSSIS